MRFLNKSDLRISCLSEESEKLLDLNTFQVRKFWSHEGFKGTVVNRAYVIFAWKVTYAYSPFKGAENILEYSKHVELLLV